jgi:ABC-type multidrug transport system ATPase subunit
VIQTRGLTKRYGKQTIVQDLDLDVRPGDRFGFLGPNGSGKSTTVRMLLGLVFPSEGEVRVLDEPMPKSSRKVLPQVGALVEGPAYYKHLSGRANLKLMDSAGPGGRRGNRRSRIQRALERVNLGKIDERPVKAYSLGMKQRLGLAAALLRTPTLLILDEPTNGLDPQGVHEVRELLKELNEAGTTVFLSSHLLHEIELLCTRVAVINNGRVVAQDGIEALRSPTGMVHIHTPDAGIAAYVLGSEVTRRDGELLVVRAADPAELNRVLVNAGVRVNELHVERRSLEDVFLELTDTKAIPL